MLRLLPKPRVGGIPGPEAYQIKIRTGARTGASTGTFFTVSGTARMVPAEDPKEHFGTKRRVVVWLYIQSVPISCKVIWEVKTLMLFRCRFKNGRCLESNKRLEPYEHPKGAIPNLLLLRIIT